MGSFTKLNFNRFDGVGLRCLADVDRVRLNISGLNEDEVAPETLDLSRTVRDAVEKKLTSSGIVVMGKDSKDDEGSPPELTITMTVIRIPQKWAPRYVGYHIAVDLLREAKLIGDASLVARASVWNGSTFGAMPAEHVFDEAVSEILELVKEFLKDYSYANFGN